MNGPRRWQISVKFTRDRRWDEHLHENVAEQI